MANLFSLEGKTALVTGGGSGIGQAICALFGQAGARVAVVDIDERAARETAGGIEAAGGIAATFQADVADPAQVDTAFAAVEDELGPLDILVNNAGIAHVGTVEMTTEADFDRVCRVNIKGAFLCAKAAVSRMAKRQKGVVLNMASIASIMGVPERFAYSTTKGAILAMTYSIATDYVTKGIRCNCICPARIHTPFVDGFVRKNYPGQEAETYQKLNAYQPIGRMGRPQEVASLALYLCSDEAAFVTGAAYPLDGGVTAM
jgi:NAD(P)-dependent dehydrogenase (short-subunit alcohol dehydrogenase family)